MSSVRFSLEQFEAFLQEGHQLGIDPKSYRPTRGDFQFGVETRKILHETIGVGQLIDRFFSGVLGVEEKAFFPEITAMIFLTLDIF